MVVEMNHMPNTWRQKKDTNMEGMVFHWRDSSGMVQWSRWRGPAVPNASIMQCPRMIYNAVLQEQHSESWVAYTNDLNSGSFNDTWRRERNVCLFSNPHCISGQLTVGNAVSCLIVTLQSVKASGVASQLARYSITLQLCAVPKLELSCLSKMRRWFSVETLNAWLQ